MVKDVLSLTDALMIARLDLLDIVIKGKYDSHHIDFPWMHENYLWRRHNWVSITERLVEMMASVSFLWG